MGRPEADMTCGAEGPTGAEIFWRCRRPEGAGAPPFMGISGGIGNSMAGMDGRPEMALGNVDIFRAKRASMERPKMVPIDHG